MASRVISQCTPETAASWKEMVLLARRPMVVRAALRASSVPLRSPSMKRRTHSPVGKPPPPTFMGTVGAADRGDGAEAWAPPRSSSSTSRPPPASPPPPAAPPAAPSSKTMSTPPTWMTSPALRIARAAFCPFTLVPLRLPMSTSS